MRRFLLGVLLGIAVAGFAAPVLAADQVSPEEIFKNRDKNGDGKLSFEEYIGNAKVDPMKAKERFDKLDKDGDGFLSFQEFAAAPRFKK